MNLLNTSSYFKYINLLGADFYTFSKIKVNINYKEKTTIIHFPSNFFPSLISNKMLVLISLMSLR